LIIPTRRSPSSSTNKECNTSHKDIKSVNVCGSVEKIKDSVYEVLHGNSSRGRRTTLYMSSLSRDFVTASSKRHGISVSKMVDHIVKSYMKTAEEDTDLLGELRRQEILEEINRLMGEEQILRKIAKVQLRSGAYLKAYSRQLMEGEPKPEKRFPLPIIGSEDEVRTQANILARREQISRRIGELLKELLPEQDLVDVALDGNGKWKIAWKE
jgi:hypothetical protein